MADRFADTFFGSYLMGGRPEFGMSPYAPTHPAQSPAEDIGTKAALLRGVLPFAPGGGIMELPDTQRAYQTAKHQFGEGNYGQALVPGLYAGLGGLEAAADAAMPAGAVWPPIMAGALGAKFLAKAGKGALQATGLNPKATDLDPSGFYSPTRRAIEGLQDTGTGNQFAGQLGGVAKVKEMEDSGVAALLESRGPNRVTKEELLQQHDRGRPKFKEIWKRDAPKAEQELARYYENWTEEDFGWALRNAEETGDQAQLQHLQETWDTLQGARSNDLPRWGKHVTPGGENYQELLLTLPGPKLPEQMATGGQGPVRLSGRYGMLADSPDEFRGGHDREPNVLIRVRTNDRTDADGQRTLFVEEFQSDWHLEGRDRGYKTGPQFSGKLSAKRMDQIGTGWEIRDENNVFVTNVLSIQAKSGDEAVAVARRRIDNPEIGSISTDYRVPDAPLKGVWPDTAMRRMIRHAAENNYDSISWTTGRMQQDRYNLSKHIDNIEVRQLSPRQANKLNSHPSIRDAILQDLRIVRVKSKDGGPIYTYAVDKDGTLLNVGEFQFPPETGKHLSDVVGNEVSQKIMAAPQKKFEGLGMADEARFDELSAKRIAESSDGLIPAERNEYWRLIKKREDASNRVLVTLEGLDLRVGGKWAESLYDEQLVNAANKWAKKRGGKVRKGTIKPSPTAERRPIPEIKDAPQSMETWILDITPEMKTNALLEGMPMYGVAAGAGLLGSAAARNMGESEPEVY